MIQIYYHTKKPVKYRQLRIAIYKKINIHLAHFVGRQTFFLFTNYQLQAFGFLSRLSHFMTVLRWFAIQWRKIKESLHCYLLYFVFVFPIFLFFFFIFYFHERWEDVASYARNRSYPCVKTFEETTFFFWNQNVKNNCVRLNFLLCFDVNKIFTCELLRYNMRSVFIIFNFIITKCI